MEGAELLTLSLLGLRSNALGRRRTPSLLFGATMGALVRLSSTRQDNHWTCIRNSMWLSGHDRDIDEKAQLESRGVLVGKFRSNSWHITGLPQVWYDQVLRLTVHRYFCPGPEQGRFLIAIILCPVYVFGYVLSEPLSSSSLSSWRASLLWLLP